MEAFGFELKSHTFSFIFSFINSIDNDMLTLYYSLMSGIGFSMELIYYVCIVNIQ